MNTVRKGPGHLLIQSSQISKSQEVFLSLFKCKSVITHSNEIRDGYLNAISDCDSDDTIVMFVEKTPPDEPMAFEDIRLMFTVELEIVDLLIILLNNKEDLCIKLIRRSIDQILMRVTGNHEAYIEAVRADVNGQMHDGKDIFKDQYKGVGISFTELSLDSPVHFSDILEPTILTEMKQYEVLDLLENRRLNYINASIKNKDWNALNIKIYDTYERFQLHYQRLLKTLESLDAGIVLGESWGSDNALMFLSVGVYSVRLYTYLDPLEIKKILLGLEYVNEQRQVDYDLFIKKKKIHWDSVRVNSLNRNELGIYYRKELETKLNADQLRDLETLESDLNSE